MYDMCIYDYVYVYDAYVYHMCYDIYHTYFSYYQVIANI